jgi:hypothetical protein
MKDFRITCKTSEDAETLIEFLRLLPDVLEFGREGSSGVYIEMTDSDIEKLKELTK